MQRNGTNITAVVKPICPISLNSDYLTTVSMPQQEPNSINDQWKLHNDSRAQLQNTFKIELSGLEEITLKDDLKNSSILSRNGRNLNSICLINQREELMIQNKEDFLRQFGLKSDIKTKVISIFGNTGDGKSHTLNNLFFNGKEVFKTSTEQTSCTFGIYCQLDEKRNCLVCDTEGLQGLSNNSDVKMRLLLKLFAISDIVIYRTMAPRLHSDMYSFLVDASRACKKYLSPELLKVGRKIDPGLGGDEGPALIIFHETFSTDPLPIGSSSQDILKYFRNLNLDISAFSALHYVGTKTSGFVHDNNSKKEKSTDCDSALIPLLCVHG